MAKRDQFLATVEDIHATGLDAALWPKALAGMARLVGGAAATLELFDKQTLRPTELYFHGIPPVAEIKYLDHYVMLNKRLPIVARDRLGEMSWDYRIFDEGTIRRDPFYMEFLASFDLCYWVGGIILTDERQFAGVCVHRSPKQGHIDKAGIALMERFLPHVRGAFDVARRLEGAEEARRSLERALDWLADGVILAGAGGALVHANEAFLAIARRNDGVRIRGGAIDFATAEAGSRFNAALMAAVKLRDGELADASADFVVARPSGSPPYAVSVRPIPGKRGDSQADARAVAMVFFHDPLSRSGAAIQVLREVFGLTEAEAHLAQALQAGIALAEYARTHAVSRNTVYTHLRRIKEKTGCHRMAELIRKLNDLPLPLRPY